MDLLPFMSHVALKPFLSEKHSPYDSKHSSCYNASSGEEGSNVAQHRQPAHRAQARHMRLASLAKQLLGAPQAQRLVAAGGQPCHWRLAEAHHTLAILHQQPGCSRLAGL